MCPTDMTHENLDIEASWENLVLTYVRTVSVLEAELQQHGLSLSEFTVLKYLANHPEHHMRMQQLADAVGLSQSAMSRLVERLKDKDCGLLERFHCVEDRRGVYTRITSRGLKRLHEARVTYLSVLESKLKEISSASSHVV